MIDDLIIEPLGGAPIGLVRLSGPLHLPGACSVMSALTTAFITAPHRVIVCDVSALDAPATDAYLAVFPAALRRAGGWPRAALHLAAPGPALATRLTAMRMHRYVPVHTTLDDALAHAALDAVTAPHRITLPPDPSSLRIARTAVTDLWPATTTTGRDEAALVVNELAANAVRHVARPFTLALAITPSRTLVAVSDPSRDEPVLRPPRGVQATNGRGIRLVAGLSQDWGVRLVHLHGKTVWAALPGPGPAVPRCRSAPRS